MRQSNETPRGRASRDPLPCALARALGGRSLASGRPLRASLLARAPSRPCPPRTAWSPSCSSPTPIAPGSGALEPRRGASGIAGHLSRRRAGLAGRRARAARSSTSLWWARWCSLARVSTTLAAIHVKDGSRLVDLLTRPPAPSPKDEKTSPGVGPRAAADERARWSLAVVGQLPRARRDQGSHSCGLRPSSLAPFPRAPMPEEDFVATVAHKALAGPVKSRLDQVWQGLEARARSRRCRDAHEARRQRARLRRSHASARRHRDARRRDFSPSSAISTRRASRSTCSRRADAASVPRARLDESGARGRAPLPTKSGACRSAARSRFSRCPLRWSLALADPRQPRLRDESRERRRWRRSPRSSADGSTRPTRPKSRAPSTAGRRGAATGSPAGLMWSGTTRAAVVRAAVSDPGELGQATTAMLKLLSVRAIAEPLSNWVGDMKLTGLGTAQRDRRRPCSRCTWSGAHPRSSSSATATSPRESDAFDIVWSVDKANVRAARQGKKPKPPTRRSREGEAGSDARAGPLREKRFTRLGPTISFALRGRHRAPRAASPAGKRRRRPSFSPTAKIRKSTDRAWFELDMPRQRARRATRATVEPLLGDASGPRARIAKPCLVPGTTKSPCSPASRHSWRASWRSTFSRRAAHASSTPWCAPSSRHEAEETSTPIGPRAGAIASR